MNKANLIFILLCVFVTSSCQNIQNFTDGSKPLHLSVGEGFVEPIGYYEKQPRFSWKLPTTAAVEKQTAYQIQVSTSPNNIKTADLWDSNKVLSSQNSWIKYQGKQLTSRQKVFWRVRFWDEKKTASDWSAISSFELGLLTNDAWQAQWIRHPETGETITINKKNASFKNKLYRPQYLRKAFFSENKIKQARLYITAKGIFKAYINGQTISDDVMTPGWTDYLQRIETLTYDVTDMVNKGPNALAVTVAEGWHTGRILSLQPRDVKPSALLAQLEIEYVNGAKKIVTTDDSWQVTLNGPIRAASNYDGETYDANYEMPGWKQADFDSSQWNDVIVEPLDPKVALTPKRHTAPTTKLVLPAKKIVEVANPQPGVVVFDMGQNMLGVPELNIPVIANQKVTVRFAEALNKNNFYTKNLRSAKATDYYIPAKSGDTKYIPSFTFHGYRYVELSGFDQSKKPDLSWVKGLVQHSDFNVHASFNSSHGKLNKLADNIVWGLRGNFLDIPTDCPQRDERLGWTGDAQVFARPSMYMADVYGFWAAWLQTVREEQAADGRVPNFIPTKQNKHTKGASSGWGDAAVIIPWELYQLTGDKQILSENYSMMQAWIKFHQSKLNNHISSLGSFGDWLQPFTQAKERVNRGDTPTALISTAYYARSLDYASRAAKTLGFNNDAKNYAIQLEKVKQAFRARFYNEQTKVKTTATQTSYLLPLAFNLFTDEGDIKRAQTYLLEEINNANNHLRTGFLGTPLLAPVLQQMGKSDLMYTILFNETYPSWFYSINNGATTTWERWNSYSLTEGFSKASMNSLNHYAYGAIAEWFYTGILGVQLKAPGFTKFKVAPQFNPKLNQASGKVPTINGDISVNWSITNKQLLMTLTVPSNSQAELQLDNTKHVQVRKNGDLIKNPAKLTPGKYQITGITTL